MLSKPRKRLRRRAQMRRSALNKVGPRTKRRAKAAAYLRRTVDPAYCEVKLEGICTGYGSEWSHCRKSRNLSGDEWERAVRSCRPCHDTTELWGEKVFRPFLEEVIARREMRS